MSKKVNQTTKIKEHLIEHRHITSLDAFKLYGCTRLSAKIFNLRKNGWVIDTQDVTSKDRYGDTCVFADYLLITEGR
mgnify:CR=1 FL=1